MRIKFKIKFYNLMKHLSKYKKKGNCDSLKEIDKFGQGFRFHLPGDKERLSSAFGALLSLLMYTLLILYGGLQLASLWKFGQTVVTLSVKDEFYSANDVFPDHIENLKYNSFSFAFGITAYDGNTESIEDPRYGRIFVRATRWGFEGLN